MILLVGPKVPYKFHALPVYIYICSASMIQHLTEICSFLILQGVFIQKSSFIETVNTCNEYP